MSNRLSNNRVNAPGRPVTPLALASVAPVRPARYAGRWTDNRGSLSDAPQ